MEFGECVDDGLRVRERNRLAEFEERRLVRPEGGQCDGEPAATAEAGACGVSVMAATAGYSSV